MFQYTVKQTEHLTTISEDAENNGGSAVNVKANCYVLAFGAKGTVDGYSGGTT